MPEVRHPGPVRRRMRELRLDLCGHRAQASLLGANRRQARAAALGAPVFPPVRSAGRGLPAPMDFGHVAAVGGEEQDRGVVGRQRGDKRACRLGYFPRRTVFRHRDPRRAGQVLLCLARRADWLSREPQELLRLRQGAQERGKPIIRRISRGTRGRAVSLHRQGHHLFPHAVLAGDAQVRAAQAADERLRPRLHYRVGREDVQVARHRHQPAALSRRGHEPRMAALLHCGEAKRQGRGHGFQSRRFRGAGEQRPGREVREYCQSGGEVYR